MAGLAAGSGDMQGLAQHRSPTATATAAARCPVNEPAI
jgi:hypothetical protein